MLTALLFSLTFAARPAPPTLTPEEVARNTVLAKYEDKRVLFRGWLDSVPADDSLAYEVRAIFYDQAAAARDQAPSRVVSVAVSFARNMARLRQQFKQSQQNGEKLYILVEGKVVRHGAGWRLEAATLRQPSNRRGK